MFTRTLWSSSRPIYRIPSGESQKGAIPATEFYGHKHPSWYLSRFVSSVEMTDYIQDLAFTKNVSGWFVTCHFAEKLQTNS